MKYCTRCLYPENHPLNITFDEQGICSGCRIHEEKDQLDWKERLEKLQTLVSEFRVTSRGIHDCIVPVSGARDSYFIVDFVKNVLKLHPLLVTYNKHYNTALGIRNLAYLRTLMGLDILTLTVSPQKVKKITRETLRQRASMYWHCIAGQTVFPVQIAVKFKIPLIIWGAHQGIDQVGMYSHLDEVEMTRKYRKEHDLMGLEAEDLLKYASDLTETDIEPYLYPHDKQIESIGLRGLYLNNYVRWDSKAQHEKMIQKYGYETQIQQRTFDTYNDVDCFHYSGLHDYIKFLKYGYGKVTDHASREIRLKRLTRQAGIELVNKYNTIIPEDLPMFLKWLNISDVEFWNYIDAKRDTRIWERRDGKYYLNDSCINHKNNKYDKPHDKMTDVCDFRVTPSKSKLKNENYILIGRGWVDNNV